MPPCGSKSDPRTATDQRREAPRGQAADAASWERWGGEGSEKRFKAKSEPIMVGDRGV